MTIFQHRLLKNFLENLVRSLAVFFVVWAVFVFPENISDLWGPGESAGEMLSSAGVLVLTILDSILPLALLVATLFTIGPLARYQELTALTATGVSMLHIVRPLLTVAVVATLFSWTLRLYGLPITADSMSMPSSAAEKTALHANLAFPLVNLFAVLTGIILAASPRRKSIYSGFGWALAMLFLFHVVNATAHALGRHGMIPPELAGWGGNFLFFSMIFVSWKRARL